MWLEPDAHILPAVGEAIASFDAVTIGPGSFFTSLMPPLLVGGVRDALSKMNGPIVLVANLLTEGRGMKEFTASEAVAWVERTLGRPVDVILFNTARPSNDALERYETESKRPLDLGTIPDAIEVVEGEFWCSDIARHDRKRLSYAIWSVLSRRLL